MKLTKYEKARIIGARALQIGMGAPILLDYTEMNFNPIEIAKAEFKKEVLPLTIRRPLPERMGAK